MNQYQATVGNRIYIQKLFKVYQQETIDRSNVQKWLQRFQKGDFNLNDKQRIGRPSTVCTSTTEITVGEMIQNDTKISMYDIMIRLDISKGSIFELIDSLRYRKTCSKWVHKLLTRDMMYSRKEICTDLLNIFCGSLTNEFRGVITCDDTCIYHCDPFSKSQSVERAHKGSPPKMKPKISKSQGKVMITVFWDQERIIFIDDLKRHATINKEKYCLSLEKLKRAIKTK